MDHKGSSRAPQRKGPGKRLLGSRAFRNRRDVEHEIAAARDRRQELARLPDFAKRSLAIATSERYRTYALALLLLRVANTAETFEEAQEAAELADAIAVQRATRNPGNRMAADLAAASRLALARWAKSPVQLEATWAALRDADALAAQGTGDAALQAALVAEWASWLWQVGSLEASARLASRASRLWQALGETARAGNAKALRSLMKLEVREKCLGEPAKGLPARPLEQQPPLIGRLVRRNRFADAWQLIAIERGALAAAGSAGSRA